MSDLVTSVLQPYPYEKVPWYSHGATMVYHGKQWYTMAWCNCTMVQINLYHGRLWYTMVHFNCTMAHPCVAMVHRTCTMVHYDILWYILAQPQYNLHVTWHAMEYDGTFSYYHGTKFLHHSILWFTMVHPVFKVYYRLQYSVPKCGIP